MSNNLKSSSFADDPPRISKPCLSKPCISKRSLVSLGHGQTYPHRMTYLQAALVATVLEDTLLHFRINMNTSNEWRVTQSLADYNKLVAIKFDVEQPKVTNELADIDPRKLNCGEYKLKKLFADRDYLREAMEKTYADLCINRSFSVLADYVRVYHQTSSHRAFVLQDEMKNRTLRRELARQIRQLRNHIKSSTYDADCTINELRTRVEDAALDSEIRSRYVATWQLARSEQNAQLIKDKESKSSVNIELYKHRYDQEMRAHAEIELVTNIMLNETLQGIEKWMAKYDQDIEIIDLKIQKIKINHIAQKEKREELENMIEEHDRLMKNWQQFKIDRENARLYREKMQNAAITVQAWWRGFLVRNQLGPYKPQPKRRGPPPKDKKKK